MFFPKAGKLSPKAENQTHDGHSFLLQKQFSLVNNEFYQQMLQISIATQFLFPLPLLKKHNVYASFHTTITSTLSLNLLQKPHKYSK